MASEASKRRSTRQAITRKRSVYLDPDTEDDFTISDDPEATSPGEQASLHITDSPPKKRKRNVKPTRPKTRSTASKPTPKKSPPNHKTKNAAKLTKEVAPVTPLIPSDGIIPKWQTLPYEILVQIFSYAFAGEVETECGSVANRRAHHPNTWITRTARSVCRAFTEPALTAFYQSPNLLASRWIDDFSNLVRRPAEGPLFSYSIKVKSLELAARNLDSQTRDRTSSLVNMLSSLSRLSSLKITHPLDEPPFEFQGRLPRWKYPPELFQALDNAGIRLEYWRWNVYLMELTDPKQTSEITTVMNEVHPRPSFQSLRHLSIGHLPAKEDADAEDDPEAVEFGKIFNNLPSLKMISFDSCDRLSLPLLLELPKTLESVKFVNCMLLNSDVLSEYLESHGYSIKELVFENNQWLDLAFLTGLRTSCPNLKILQMDLYDHRENYFRHFAEPRYENLLLEDEIPTWPSSLQVLELVHMQKLGANAAQNFFRSLVESADSLLDLRRLVLQAHINISWRDRAAFRDQWIERLRRVYQRYPKEPDPKLVSLKAFRQWKESQVTVTQGETGRRMSPVEIMVQKPDPDTKTTDSLPIAQRRSKRMPKPTEAPAPEPPAASSRSRGRRKRGRSDSDAISVVSDKNDQDAEDWRNKPENFIQGMCDVVDIRIDNQRPREEQFNESHFLDSEASGDEEWTEGADIDADDYAW